MIDATVRTERSRLFSGANPRDRVAGRTVLGLAIGCALALLALGLRLHSIDREPLWLDEGYTLLFSSLPFERLFLVGGAHEHPPLYYLIVHVLLGVRDSYLTARTVSAVSGSLSVIVLYALGTRLYGRIAGLTAGALLTVSPFHVWYSQDARAYELAGLLVLGSYLAIFCALDRPRRGVWLAYAGCTALALYTEYTTVFVLLPQALFLIPARRSSAVSPLVKAWAGIALLFAPWLGMVALDAASIAGNYWIPAPTVSDVTTTILEFLGMRSPCPSPPCTGGEVSLPLLTGHEGMIAALAVCIVVGLIVLALSRRDFPLGVIVCWLVLPFVLVLVIGVVRPLYLDRIFLDATFPLYLLLGAGAPAVGRGAWRSIIPPLVAVAVGVASIANLHPVYSEVTNPDWATAAHDLYTAHRPGQAIVFNPGALQRLVNAYLPSRWSAAQEYPLWYHNYLDVPGWQARYGGLSTAMLRTSGLTVGQQYAVMDATLRDDELREATRQVRQVWLVTQDYSGLNDTRRWFAVHGFHLVLSEIYFDDARLELWDRALPADLGPSVMRDTGFHPPWTATGGVRVDRTTARMSGAAMLTRSFQVQGGAAYSVNLEYLALPPAYPSVHLELYDRVGRPVGQIRDRFDNRLATFPRTEWYNLPVTGAWLSEPFGFIAPRGAVRAILHLQNAYGLCSWRRVAVFRER